MEFVDERIPRDLQFAFQEYDVDKLDIHEHDFTVIERTLAYGNRQELRWLFACYGAQRLADWVREWGWRLLPRRRLGLWVCYFDIQDIPQRKGVWPY